MLIEIGSRFASERPYLSAHLQAGTDSGYEVTNLFSPIERVQQYYEHILDGDFDYSLVTGRGQQLFYGAHDRQARNLLLAIAQESAQHGRQPRFLPSSEVLRDWFTNPQLAEAILNRNIQLFAQVDIVIGPDVEASYDFAAWMYFFLQQSLISGRLDTTAAGEFLRTAIADQTEFSLTMLSAINRIDPTFIGLWAEEGSYQLLRPRLASRQQNLDLLASFAPATDPRAVRPSRSSSRLQIAARSATLHSVVTDTAMWERVEAILSNAAPCPTPTFLPEPGSPSRVATSVLRYFNFDLPPLEEVARVLGTQIISAELPEDILGLFVTNVDAHHSAILINRQVRNFGSQRFTIGHELGHYLLHTDHAFLCGYREIYEHQPVAEAQANAFAADLLMPAALMRDITNRRFDYPHVREISERFHCSNEAAARRFIDIAQRRELALVVVKNGRILSVAATVINGDGVRWIGRPTLGNDAVSLDIAQNAHARRENRLWAYLPSANADRRFQDLDIDLYPFHDGDGYYLFVERSR